MSKLEGIAFGTFAALWVLLCVAANVAVIYIVLHFIAKYW